MLECVIVFMFFILHIPQKGETYIDIDLTIYHNLYITHNPISGK